MKDGKFESPDELRAWLDRPCPPREYSNDPVNAALREPDVRDWYEFALEQLDVVDVQMEAGHA